VFELAQDLTARWLTDDNPTKRLLLDIVCLNLRLGGRTLVPTLRKPFDLLAEGGLRPQREMVGAIGFEPTTSATPLQRASHAAPRPDPSVLGRCL
jgi:hypothetical protein